MRTTEVGPGGWGVRDEREQEIKSSNNGCRVLFHVYEKFSFCSADEYFTGFETQTGPSLRLRAEGKG